LNGLGELRVYQLDDSGRLCNPDASNRYWVPKWVCFGAMAGTRENRTDYWLSGGIENGELLLLEIGKIRTTGRQAND